MARKTLVPRLLLACGCVVRFTDGETPLCGHGPQRVVRTLGMPKPRISGSATGPLVRTQEVAAYTTVLPGVTPLPALKESGRHG